jgi:manganese/iron transport system permease protein/iron/zinc/copper transport system permease protein
MTDVLYNAIIEPLRQPFFQKALIGGILVAIVCGVVGCFVILRRMAFLGDAISHAMLAGVTGGYLFMRLVFGASAHAPAMLIGALIAAVVTVGLIGFVSHVSRIKEDTAIGIIYTGVFAAGGVLASVFSHKIPIDLFHFVMGQVLAVGDGDLWVAGIVASVVLSAVLIFYRQLQLTSFDRVMAASIGVPVLLVDYLLTSCTALVVVSGVTMVGIILVVGLLVTPAASAYLLCNRLHRMLVVSALFGVTSVVGGLYVSLWANVAGGSAIALFGTVQFLLVLVIAPRYGLIAGWLRRIQTVPQQLVEDILSSAVRYTQDGVAVKKITENIHARADEIQRALRAMQRRGLITVEAGSLSLTRPGRSEARRILRAHRLWETYLQHVGTPAGEIHDRAHQLEHVHDERAVDYLDDKLGHPLRDPHGAEIPMDFVDVVPGRPVKASLLRQGHVATVDAVLAPADDAVLRPGMSVRVGPRRDNETVWTLILPDGREVELDHDAADAVMVRVKSARPNQPSGS